MPRIARIVAVGYPHHITQRGNNRVQVFFDEEDRMTFLRLLSANSKKYRLQIWAYCLMDNHIHLLAVPETEISLSRGVGMTNMMYTQYINKKYSNSGRIWQNRFFSCVVENDRYVWAVARYIERNPLHIEGITDPTTYRWSSAKAHVAGKADPMLYKKSWLPRQRRVDYAEFFHIEDTEVNDAIRQSTKTGRPYASERLMKTLEVRLNISLKPKKLGRPAKKLGSVPNKK